MIPVRMITDGRGDVVRLRALVQAAVQGGLRSVQVREPALGARQLCELCLELQALLRPAGGELIVNDRADVAAAGCADGVHLGRRSLWPSQARRFLPPGSVVGFSAHDADEIAWASAEGADYVTLSPVFSTASKPGARAIGPAAAQALSARAALPVVWLGGLDERRVAALPRTGPAGIAVMSALCGSGDARAAAERLLAAWHRRTEVP